MVFAKRINNSLTAQTEAKIIQTILPHIPQWVTPNLLTFIGFISAVIASASYLTAPHHPVLLFVINLLLIVNWFGDSLDGRLAVFREIERPRFGFYVDHLLDALSVSFICLGITVSSITLRSNWSIILVLYLLLEFQVFLESTLLKKFIFSFAVFGPTEARIVLATFNAFGYFLWTKQIILGGEVFRYFDLLGAIGVVVLSVMFAVSAFQTGRVLYFLKHDRKRRTRLVARKLPVRYNTKTFGV